MSFDIFLAYSRRADAELAKALQRSLERRFTKPWYKRRSMRVFRLDGVVTVGDEELQPTIRAALSQAGTFVLLASPASAQSRWVQEELLLWLNRHSLERLIVVIADGEIAWDRSRGDFDFGNTTSLSPALSGLFSEEPILIDLRDISDRHDPAKHPRFNEAILTLAAIALNIPREDLLRDELIQQRRVRTALLGTVGGLIALFLASLVAATAVVRERNRALAAEGHAIQASKEAKHKLVLAETQKSIAEMERRQAEHYRRELEDLRAQLAKKDSRREGASDTGTIQQLVEQLKAAEVQTVLAKSFAEQTKQELETQRGLAKQLHDQLETRRRLTDDLSRRVATQETIIDELEARVRPRDSWSKISVDFVQKNALVLGQISLGALLLVTLSTRWVLILLQISIWPITMLAAGFYVTGLGKWRLYRNYIRAVPKQRDVMYHTEHYVELPFEPHSNEGSLKELIVESLAIGNVFVTAEGGRGKRASRNNIYKSS